MSYKPGIQRYFLTNYVLTYSQVSEMRHWPCVGNKTMSKSQLRIILGYRESGHVFSVSKLLILQYVLIVGITEG